MFMFTHASACWVINFLLILCTGCCIWILVRKSLQHSTYAQPSPPRTHIPAKIHHLRPHIFNARVFYTFEYLLLFGWWKRRLWPPPILCWHAYICLLFTHHLGIRIIFPFSTHPLCNGCVSSFFIVSHVLCLRTHKDTLSQRVSFSFWAPGRFPASCLAYILLQ